MKQTKQFFICIIKIKNYDDNLCCPRAIIVALSTKTNNILGHELDKNKIKQLKIEVSHRRFLDLEQVLFYMQTSMKMCLLIQFAIFV